MAQELPLIIQGHVNNRVTRDYSYDIENEESKRGRKLHHKRMCISFQHRLQFLFLIILVVSAFVSMLQPSPVVKGKCVIGVFSEDDEVAADCIYVFKGYYMFYAIFNVLPWIIFKVIDNSGQSFFLTTRRALKRRMRCAVVIFYPFLLIQIALMLSIYLRI